MEFTFIALFQQVAILLNSVVESVCQAEIKFVCIERIDEYSKIKSEVSKLSLLMLH